MISILKILKFLNIEIKCIDFLIKNITSKISLRNDIDFTIKMWDEESFSKHAIS